MQFTMQAPSNSASRSAMPHDTGNTTQGAGQRWPRGLWLVRHGQSAGNVARDEAEAARHPRLVLATRDVDTPLSPLGEAQARAVAAWFGTLEWESAPVVLSSPYLRSVDTASVIAENIGSARVTLDERLREKEFGVLDRMTTHGIRAHYPDLAEQRAHVGKFYFRPPGGESWCDVILRLRSVIDTLTRDHCGGNVVIVAHQVIVNCFRYLLEELSEAQILAIDREADVPNCGVTSYRCEVGLRGLPRLALERANFVAPLLSAGTPVTAAADVPAAPKS